MSEQNAQLNPAAADDPEPVPPTAKRKAVQADDPGSQALAQDVAVLSGQSAWVWRGRRTRRMSLGRR